MGKKPAQRKKQNLLREFKLSMSLAQEPSTWQIGQLLTQELTSESKTRETFDKDEQAKSKKETNMGRILIICDTPIPENLIPWLAAKRYHYTMVNSEEEAVSHLDREHFDCVVYSHEFY